MLKGYLATERDLAAIDETLNFVWHPKMDFVFQEREKIANTFVVSYDSKFIYLWRPKTQGEYKLYRFPHKLQIKNGWQYGWCAGLWDKSIKEVLPSPINKASRFAKPITSGGLLTSFTKLQKKRKPYTNWPYTTRESYLATIIHEFGHVYWNQHKLWWYSDKKENLRYLKLAKNLYQKRSQVSKVSLRVPISTSIGEVFAFCTEYYASSVFWPKHKEALDRFIKQRLENLIEEEKKKDLESQDSVLEPSKNSHDFALIFGRILLSQYPKSWPQVLTVRKAL